MACFFDIFIEQLHYQAARCACLKRLPYWKRLLAAFHIIDPVSTEDIARELLSGDYSLHIIDGSEGEQQW